MLHTAAASPLSLVPPNKKLMKYFPGNNTLQTAEHTVQYSTVQYSTVQYNNTLQTAENKHRHRDGWLPLLAARFNLFYWTRESSAGP